MKQGWEIKKLGEFANIKSGKSIDANLILDNISLYPCYGGNGIRGYVKNYRYNGCFPVIGRVGALCGNVHLAKGQFNATEHALIVEIKHEDINPEWLTYNLISLKLRRIAKGVAQPVIAASEVAKIPIAIPPLPEQERIVAELDCLSSIIEKQKEQLKELDNLAQSIFYTMFGDPITNERGWEERSLTDVCTNLFAGGDVPKGDYSETKTEQHSTPILSNGVGDKALYGYTSNPRVNEVSLTISGRGTIGYCEVRTTPFLPVVRLIVATPNTDIILPITLKFIVDALKLKGTGGTIPQLTIPMIKNKKIILPPIGIQQEFASKIEAIEKQKKLIKQSLSETDTLFNSRMDYYFN